MHSIFRRSSGFVDQAARGKESSPIRASTTSPSTSIRASSICSRACRRHERRRRGRGAGGQAQARGKPKRDGIRNGTNMSTVLVYDRAVLGRRRPGAHHSAPRSGQAALAAVANDDQLKRFHGKWARVWHHRAERGQRIGGFAHHRDQRRRLLCAEREKISSPPASARTACRVGDARSQPWSRSDQELRVEKGTPG